MIEIERKFLVKTDAYKKEAYRKSMFIQAYLNTHPERTIRIRITDDTAYLTIKGKTSESGLSRYEWEKKIPVEEAEALLVLCEPGKIEKYRYLVKSGIHVFEIDEFRGDNDGLVIAEVELETEKQNFIRPNWLGEEVTGNNIYYNSNLTVNPFNTWER